MIKIGDRVKFLNEIGGGIVRGFVNKATVNVEDETGFEIPVSISELVKIDSGDKTERNERIDVSEKIEGLANEKVTPAFFLTFAPKSLIDPLNHSMELFFVNECDYNVLFYLSQQINGTYFHLFSGSIGPYTKKILHSFSASDLKKAGDLYIQFIYFQDKSDNLDEPISKKIKINPIKLSKRENYYHSAYFENDVYSIALVKHELEKVVNKDLIISNEEIPVSINKPERDIVEVDLHINQLLDSTVGLSNHELLEIQIGRFNNEMESAIKNNVRRIVFIHGVGNGKLKGEIIRELKKKYSKYYFQDASFKEYGYGATMVILRKY